MCASPGLVNLPYTIWFICFGIGGLTTFPFIDKLGRLGSHKIFSTANILAQIVIVFVPSMLAHEIGFGLLGFFMAKHALSYSWAFELMPKEQKSLASTCINTLDFSVCVYSGLYFLLAEEPDWKVLCYPLFFIGVFGYLMCTLLIPESPRWLLLQGRDAEAIQVLNYIGRINRSPNRINPDTQFIEAGI